MNRYAQIHVCAIGPPNPPPLWQNPSKSLRLRSEMRIEVVLTVAPSLKASYVCKSNMNLIQPIWKSLCNDLSVLCLCPCGRQLDTLPSSSRRLGRRAIVKAPTFSEHRMTSVWQQMDWSRCSRHTASTCIATLLQLHPALLCPHRGVAMLATIASLLSEHDGVGKHA